MAKYTIEADDKLIGYFKEKIDDTSKTEVMLVNLLELLRELLEVANNNMKN